MKYWWLEKYRDFKIIQLKELLEDVNYFLTMPKNYDKKYQELMTKDIENLEEEELLILLRKIMDTRNVKDNSLNIIIHKLLKIPDNSFPASDYTMQEILTEIKNLKKNPPYQEKVENNNIAVCYHCLNIFYVDKIKSVNKNHLCLCPYCSKSELYFDNDYIPMNYTFIKLAYLYYHTSNLGCHFKEKKKIIEKCVSTTTGKIVDDCIKFGEIFQKEKLEPILEKKIYRDLYLAFLSKDKDLQYDSTLYISNLSNNIKTLLQLILVVILEVLSSTLYLKKIKIIFENDTQEKEFLSLLQTLKKFY